MAEVTPVKNHFKTAHYEFVPQFYHRRIQAGPGIIVAAGSLFSARRESANRSRSG